MGVTAQLALPFRSWRPPARVLRHVPVPERPGWDEFRALNAHERQHGCSAWDGYGPGRGVICSTAVELYETYGRAIGT